MSEPYDNLTQEQINAMRGMYEEGMASMKDVVVSLEPLDVHPQFYVTPGHDTFVAVPIRPQFPEVLSDG